MKTKTLIIILCLAMAGTLQPLRAATLQQDDKIYDKVDTPPAFPGGVEAMFEYLQRHISWKRKQKVFKGELLCSL